MKLQELLNEISILAKENNLPEPFIVGGLPRDKSIGLGINSVKDIDITTGDNTSITLSILINKKWPTTYFRTYDDGHSSINFKNIQIDLSNNFIIPGVELELEKMGLEKSANLMKEVASRDFTINTLLQPMDLKKDVLDLTKMGLKDIENKLIRTPINSDLTIGYDARRILRAIKLAIKFDFAIDDSLKESILKYRGNIKDLPIGQIKKQINKMLEMNTDKTLELLKEFKLLPIIPLSKMMQTKIIDKKMVNYVLE